MFRNSFLAAPLVNILNPHCSVYINFLVNRSKPKIKCGAKIDDCLCVADGWACSQKNHQVKALHKKVAIPLPLKDRKYQRLGIIERKKRR